VAAISADTLLFEEFTTDLADRANKKNVLINNNRPGTFDGGVATNNVSGMGYELKAETEITRGNSEIHFNIKKLGENEYILKIDPEADKKI